jgi:hypothetical protein
MDLMKMLALQQQMQGIGPLRPEDQMTVAANGPIQMPAPQMPPPSMPINGPMNKPKALIEQSFKQSGFKGSYGDQFDDAFFESMGNRKDALEKLRAKQAELDGKAPSGFETVNLKPLMAYADSLTGTNLAGAYTAPTQVAQYNEKMQKLQDAISKNENTLSDDQLAYLRTKAQEESMKLREQSMANAMSRAGEGEESKVRREYLNHPVVKSFKDVDASASAIEANPGDTGPAQQAMVFQFSKILDPGSVVRETEYAQSAANAGLLNQATNLFNKMKSGEMLTPDQIMMMKTVVRNLAQSHRDRYNQVNEYYGGLSQRKGFDSRNVIVDPYMGGKSDMSKKSASNEIKPGTVEDGYEFLGGDPKNPASWKAVK